MVLSQEFPAMNRIEMPIRPFSLEEEDAAGAVPPHPVATIIVAAAREEMRVKRVARFVTMMLLNWVGCSHKLVECKPDGGRKDHRRGIETAGGLEGAFSRLIPVGTRFLEDSGTVGIVADFHLYRDALAPI